MTLALWLVGFAVLRLSFLAPESCPPVDDERALQAAVDAGRWIAAGQSVDGRFLYEYDRTDGEARPGYNIVRHAGVTLSLYQLVGAGDETALEPADVRALAVAVLELGLGLVVLDQVVTGIVLLGQAEVDERAVPCVAECHRSRVFAPRGENPCEHVIG